jgi:hypothetical protein
MSARIGKLFSDLSENCFRGERKYLSGSEKMENYDMSGNVCILGKIMICPENF